MSNEQETICEATASEVPTECADKRLRWFELLLVLLVCFGNSIVSSISILIYGRAVAPHPSGIGWTSGIVHEVASLLLLGYVLARRRIGFATLGLRWSFRDLGIGLAVAVAAFLAYTVGSFLVYLVAPTMHLSVNSDQIAREIFGRPTIVAIPFSLLNPFFEELIVRAYLMTEVKALTGSWILSVALSVVVQSSYHLYYGWGGGRRPIVAVPGPFHLLRSDSKSDSDYRRAWDIRFLWIGPNVVLVNGRDLSKKVKPQWSRLFCFGFA